MLEADLSTFVDAIITGVGLAVGVVLEVFENDDWGRLFLAWATIAVAAMIIGEGTGGHH